jgi:hypothetical protein
MNDSKLREITDELVRIADDIGEAQEDHRTLLRVGGVPVGAVVAMEVLLDGKIVYEVEPFPAWSGLKPRPRWEIKPDSPMHERGPARD